MELKELSETLPNFGDKVEDMTLLHKKRRQLMFEQREEASALEKKFHAKSSAIYEERKRLCQDIPNFWRIVLSNHPAMDSLLTPEDKEILSYLSDITLSYPDSSPSFVISFHFLPNPYFSNSVLTKRIVLSNQEDLEGGDYAFENSEGCQIDWKEGKNVCFRKVTKTQRNKKTQAVRETVVESPQPSFFHFFGDCKYLMPDEENEDLSDFEDSMQAELSIAEDFKSWIIPEALDLFMNGGDFSDDDDEYDEDDSDEDDEDGSEDDSSDSGSPPKRSTPGLKGNPQECKQQ